LSDRKGVWPVRSILHQLESLLHDDTCLLSALLHVLWWWDSLISREVVTI